jgi:hypothetical protein
VTLSFSGRTPRCLRGRGSSILPRVANHASGGRGIEACLTTSRRRVAQQDRALVSDARGRRIEACRDGQIGALTGDGAGPVLKTVSTATCGDRDLSAPPVQGRLTGQEPGAGWKPRGTLNAYGHRALSLPPLRKVNPAGAGRPFEAGWMGNHWGSRPRPSASSRGKGRDDRFDAEWSTGSSLGSYRGRPLNSGLRNQSWIGWVLANPRRCKRPAFALWQFNSAPIHHALAQR